LALGINHLDSRKRQPIPGRLSVQGEAALQEYWVTTLRPPFADWNLTSLDNGAPPALRSRTPWFATLTLAAIEKHRSDPRRYDPFLIGYMWTDTPTWDLLKTRALRGTEWVSALRTLPPAAPGRRAYADFLEERYANRLADLNHLLCGPTALRASPWSTSIARDSPPPSGACRTPPLENSQSMSRSGSAGRGWSGAQKPPRRAQFAAARLLPPAGLRVTLPRCIR
jgi:hypothetical protein